MWQLSFINPAAGVTTKAAGDTCESCLAPEFVVAKIKEVSGSTNTYVHCLQALDLATGPRN